MFIISLFKMFFLFIFFYMLFNLLKFFYLIWKNSKIIGQESNKINRDNEDRNFNRTSKPMDKGTIELKKDQYKVE